MLQSANQLLLISYLDTILYINYTQYLDSFSAMQSVPGCSETHHCTFYHIVPRLVMKEISCGAVNARRFTNFPYFNCQILCHVRATLNNSL